MNCKKMFFAVLSALVLFASCSNNKDLTDAIPADASYVVYVDAKSLIEKSEYDIFNNQMVKMGIGMYKASLKDETAVKLFDGFLSDANSLGVNLKNDMFFYTDYKVYGFVLGVNNADKIKEALIKFAVISEDEIKKEGGIYTVAPSPVACFAWNSDKLLMLVDITASYNYGKEAAEPVDLGALAKTQLEQGSDKSINSNKTFGEFWKDRKEISFFYSTKGLDKSLDNFAGLSNSSEFIAPFRKIFADMEGVSTGAYISFEKGEIKAESKYFYEDAQAEKKYKELTSQLSGPITGDQLKYITTEPLLLAAAHLKGEGVYSYLEKTGLVELFIKNNELQDGEFDMIRDIIKNVNGDITFAVGSENITLQENVSMYDMPTPQVAFFANVTNPSMIVDLLKTKLTERETKYVELSQTALMIESDKMSIYFGTEENTFFVTNTQSVYDNLRASNLPNNYLDVVKDKSFIMLGDLQGLQSYTANNNSFKAFGPFLSEFGKYQFVGTSDLQGTGKLELVTKDKNSLAVICQKLDELISSFAGQMGR